MNETKKQEPTCQACGRAKSAHNILAQVAAPPGAVRNGPYTDADGQVFCRQYREAK